MHETTEIHRNVDVGDEGGEGTGGWGRIAFSPLLLASIPHPSSPSPHPIMSDLSLRSVHLYRSTLVLKSWKADRLWQDPWESAAGAGGSQPCGQQEDTEKGGIISTYLGIRGDIPDSGQGLECSRKKRNLGSQISHFKATPLISLTPTPKHRLWSQADKELGLTCDLKPQFTQL